MNTENYFGRWLMELSNEKDNVGLIIDGEKLIKLYCDRNCVGDCSDSVKKAFSFMRLVNDSIIGNDEDDLNNKEADDIKLLTCPFCGGEADLEEYTGSLDCKKFAVECRNIECPTLPCTEWHLDKDAAIKAWNTRKPIEQIIKRLEESKLGARDSKDLSKYSAYEQAIEIVKEGV